MHNNFVVRVILVFHCLVAGAFAQEATWNDFLYQFQNCHRIKTTMTCSVLVTNQKQRRELSFYSSIKLFDNMGNEVTSSEIRFTSNGSYEKELITGVPAELEFKFDGVSALASSIAILSIYGGYVEFSNLSFSELQPQTTQQTVYDNYLYDLKGCNKVDTTITCLFTITNLIQNREIAYYSPNRNIGLFDNLGNEFRASEAQFTSNGSFQKQLTTGVPAELKIIFNGVFSQATSIGLLDLQSRLFRHIPFSNPQPLTDYDIGKEAGKQECLANPASCDIVSSDGKNASFDPNKGKLYLPFVNVPDTSGKVTVYQVELNQQAPYFVFELDVESIQQVSEEDK